MTAEYQYTSISAPPPSNSMGRAITASAMADKAYEGEMWNADTQVLKVLFTNVLSAGDETILDGIVAVQTTQLEINRAAKIQAIDRQSTRLMDEGFAYDGRIFSMSSLSQIKLLSLRTAAIAGVLIDPDHYPIAYACLDEHAYDIANETALVAMFDAGFNTAKTILASGATLKDQCMDAADQAALDAIVDNRT